MVEEHGGEVVTLNLKMEDSQTATQAEMLFQKAGVTTAVENDTLMVNGDLEVIFRACLDDAESAYHNRKEDFAERYGVGARQSLHAWWQALRAMEKDLNRQKLFAAAQLTHTVQAKTVECAYNYYGIEVQAIKDRWGTVLFSLVFYVLYTVWYGYAIMYIFEGLGFELAAH
jgi:ubiquinone biosynthesis protein UbiJ